MTPQELIATARRLIDDPLDITDGVWGRAAVFLARQALELRMSEILTLRAPGSEAATFSAQLLVLGEVLGDRDIAKHASFTWSALSGASHVQGYELSPTAPELRNWVESVQKFLDSTAGR